MSNMRDSSRQSWTSGNTIQEINAGSFQRIADACELMAKSHAQLIEERDRYKRWHEEGNQRIRRLETRASRYRAYITYLKRKLREHTQS
jgi:hypothetical protein